MKNRKIRRHGGKKSWTIRLRSELVDKVEDYEDDDDVSKAAQARKKFHCVECLLGGFVVGERIHQSNQPLFSYDVLVQ